MRLETVCVYYESPRLLCYSLNEERVPLCQILQSFLGCRKRKFRYLSEMMMGHDLVAVFNYKIWFWIRSY